MTKLFWLLSLVATGIAGITLASLATANGAPQQAAIAAIAAATAIIPYCWARAISELGANATERKLAELNELAATRNRLLAAVADAVTPAATIEQERK